MNYKFHIAIALFLVTFECLKAQVIPAPTCASATVYNIAELDSLTGTMLDTPNPTGATPLCPTGGAAHNTSWVAFYSWGGTYHFQLEFDNCSVNGTGVQFGVWGDCGFTESIYCDPACTGPGKKGFDATLESGKIYYMFFDGCSGDVCDYVFHVGKPINTLTFRNFIDENTNCMFDQNETQIKLLTLGHSYKGKTDYYPLADLHLPLFDFETGVHKFWIKESSKNWQTCADTIIYNLDSTSADTVLDLGIHQTGDCPEVSIEISTDRLRFCADNVYKIKYSNNSIFELPNQTIQLNTPVDLTLVGASIPVQTSNPPFYTFYSGTMSPFSSKEFTVTVHTPCERDKLMLTYCSEARFLLDTICDPDSLWDGSSLSVRAECDKASKKVKFIIDNMARFDMTREAGYAIIEDEIMPLLKGTIKLKMEESRSLDFPARGSTYRLILDQVLHHPGNSHPTIALEGCGEDANGEFSTGRVLQFPEDEQDENVSVDCKELRGSYDPNDKLASPIGFSDNHFIENNTPIEYLIRFQNEGNDVAERIVILDKLDQNIDVSNFELIGSSHPVTYSIHDRYVEFIFDKINLTYKSKNDITSRGYVNYRVSLKPDLPVGTRIENAADIFFDHNPAIRTNETYHTTWEKIITQIYSSDEQIHALVYPNPTDGRISIELPKDQIGYTLDVIDVNGKLRHTQQLNIRKTQLFLDEYAQETGVYLIKLTDTRGSFSIFKVLYMR
ncbi:MAG: T9SS type A sorting domain-containing protein [Saprospiraceae bacterium]|nr:T9SS type A sorting domain-containing protein [Saprospiraceae bacterium]HMW39138.1 T9SS type A sorting domain-containing protein [Saprospiraceae bacterium]HMX89641.1 T9SS type A sorting domain-containing protein [Saprospiraceae bacterium]HMZ40660.1 T9SS type A sorting domain-containing protein [Saprospiraceae bacterium]HNA65244.1 T9SS type A sorting domain-containing protein [Saprospiraceae bacterium]